MTDRMKNNSLKQIFILLVEGLPSLDDEAKKMWLSLYDDLGETDCIEIMEIVFDQSLEFIERAKVELKGNPHAVEDLAQMEKKAKVLLEVVNADLVALHLKPLH